MLYIKLFHTHPPWGKDDTMPRSHMKRRKVNRKHRKNVRRMKARDKKRRVEAKAAAAKAKKK